MNQPVRKYWIGGLFTICFLGLLWAAAQSGLWRKGEAPLPAFEDEFRKLANRQTTDDTYVKGRIKLYDGHESDKILEEKELEFCRQGKAIWSRLDILEVLIYDSLHAQVDHDYKEIVISRLQQDWEQMAREMTPVNDLLKEDASFRIRGKVQHGKGPHRKIVFINETQPEIWQTVVEYDTIDYRIKGCEIAWLKEDEESADGLSADRVPACWVSRTEFEYPVMKTGFISNRFHEALKRGKKGWEPGEKLTEYQVVDATMNQP